jgi:hypothetical protein
LVHFVDFDKVDIWYVIIYLLLTFIYFNFIIPKTPKIYNLRIVYNLDTMPSNQTYNIARGLVRGTSGAGGAHRLIFQNQFSNYNYNRFIPGSGVGGMNRSVRRYQYRHATSCQTASGTQRGGVCFQN